MSSGEDDDYVPSERGDISEGDDDSDEEASESGEVQCDRCRKAGRKCEPGEAGRLSCKACATSHVSCSLARNGKGEKGKSGRETNELLVKLLHMVSAGVSATEQLTEVMEERFHRMERLIKGKKDKGKGKQREEDGEKDK